jgi:ABC-type transport system involved in cytochrome bd biosynthesis fused ATPase/permease subunit
MGTTGCGKSTTFGLLQRFYLPSTGKIKIDCEIESIDEEKESECDSVTENLELNIHDENLISPTILK